ncbi:MAG: amidohydrolase [Firmicutes bacterium]|nr:amidohydrolase [Bacillota bacterium]
MQACGKNTAVREPVDVAAALARPKIDMHAHVWPMQGEAVSSSHLIACGARLGITEFWCSAPITGGRLAPIEEVRAHNDVILRAMERHPGRIRGMAFLIPGQPGVIEEAERCLGRGMIGFKLYNQYKLHDPVVEPIIKLATERRVPVLVHAAYLPAPEHQRQQPLTSHGADFAVASEKYPDALLIHAHIGGGGDWEWTLRALRDASPNVYVDVSGSNLDAGQVEMAVAELGAKRVLFGTDGTMAGSVGKVLDADLTEEEQDLIFWRNAARLLAEQGLAPLNMPRGDAQCSST